MATGMEIGFKPLDELLASTCRDGLIGCHVETFRLGRRAGRRCFSRVKMFRVDKSRNVLILFSDQPRMGEIDC